MVQIRVYMGVIFSAKLDRSTSLEAGEMFALPDGVSLRTGATVSVQLDLYTYSQRSGDNYCGHVRLK